MPDPTPSQGREAIETTMPARTVPTCPQWLLDLVSEHVPSDKRYQEAATQGNIVDITDNNSDINLAIEKLDVVGGEIDSILEDVNERYIPDSADPIPAPWRKVILDAIEVSLPAYRDFVENCSTSILRGRITEEQLRFIRCAVNSPDWCSSVSPTPITVMQLWPGTGCRLICEEISRRLGIAKTPEAALRADHTPIISLAGVSESPLPIAERVAVLKEVLHELVGAIAAGGSMRGVLATLQLENDKLSNVAGRHVAAWNELVMELKPNELTNRSVTALLDRVSHGAAVSRAASTETITFGTVLLCSANTSTSYRQLSPEVPLEAKVLRGLLWTYVEELGHCLQDSTRALQDSLESAETTGEAGTKSLPDYIADRARSGLVSELAKRYFNSEGDITSIKVSRAAAIGSNADATLIPADEIDVLGFMIEECQKWGIDPNTELDLQINSYHKGWRAPFVNWLRRERVLDPRRHVGG